MYKFPIINQVRINVIVFILYVINECLNYTYVRHFRCINIRALVLVICLIHFRVGDNFSIPNTQIESNTLINLFTITGN